MPLRAYRAVACHCFDQKKPVLLNVMHHNIRHLSMFFNLYAYFFQSIGVKISPFGFGIADIDYATARRKELAKVVDNLLYQNILAARRKFDLLPGRELYWDTARIPFPRITLLQRLNGEQILFQLSFPARLSKPSK